MPRITKTTEQQRALKEVSEHIKVLQKINGFVGHASQDYRMVITAKSTNGETLRYTGDLGIERVNDFLHDYRKQLIKRVQKLAQEFRMEFTPSELELLK